MMYENEKENLESELNTNNELEIPSTDDVFVEIITDLDEDDTKKKPKILEECINDILEKLEEEIKEHDKKVLEELNADDEIVVQEMKEDEKQVEEELKADEKQFEEAIKTIEQQVIEALKEDEKPVDQKEQNWVSFFRRIFRLWHC